MAIVIDSGTITPPAGEAAGQTFYDLIEEVLARLQQHAGLTPVMGTVKTTITADAMTFSTEGPILATGSGFTPGYMQVGEEVVYVQAVDATTGVCTGVLRGQMGTTPTAHPAGTPVIDKPQFMRHDVARSINQTIVSLFPKLVKVATVTVPVTNAELYALPADMVDVLDVRWTKDGQSRLVNQWNPEHQSATASGKGVWVGDWFGTGSLRITYTGRPSKMVNLADDYQAVTGLPGWTSEVAVLGACVKLTTGVDVGRAMSQSLEQRQANGQQPYRIEQASKYFVALFQQALMDASNSQKAELPVRIHYTL